MTARILYQGKSISHINKPLYHYAKRRSSITSSSTKTRESLEMRNIVIDGISNYIGHDKRFKATCDNIKLYTKLEFRGAFTDAPKEWFDLYKESHCHIWKFNLHGKQKILWIFLLQNYIFYQLGRYLYYLLKGKSLWERNVFIF